MEILVDIITGFSISLLVKLFLLFLMVFYFVFAIVAYKQVSLMTQVLNSSISPVIRLVAIFQIVAVTFLFFLVMVLV